MTKKTLWMVFLISFSLGSFFAFCFHHPIEADASGYDTIGWNLAQGNGFSLKTQAPFAPTMHREPVYPYFLCAIYKLFGHNYKAVYFFQIFIFSLTSILVYFLANNLFGEKVANFSAIFVAFCPTLANYPSYLLAETLFAFLLCLSILMLTKAAKTQKTMWFFVSGATLALTALCKVVVLLFFFAVLLKAFLLRKGRKDFFKRRVSHLAIFSCAFLIVVSPWVYRNYRLFDYAQVSLRGGRTLWEVAYKLDESFEHMKQAAVFNFSEYLGTRLFPEAADTPRDFILMRSKKSHARADQLRQQNFSPVEIDKVMKKEAWEKIRAQRHPILKLLAHIPLELTKMTAFIYIPTLNEPHIINRFFEIRNGRLLLSVIRGVFRLMAYPVIILAVIGMWHDRKRWLSWYFPFAAVIYFNLVYGILFGMGRYAVPIIPFYLIFTAEGLLKCRFSHSL